MSYRIILADSEMSYLLPLQRRLIKELGQEAALEIITDPIYFQAFLEQSQKADIMLVSQEMYSPLMERQKIPAVFVLTEGRPVPGAHMHGGVPVYKYLSVKEIVDTMLSGSTPIRRADDETKVVCVAAPKGGSGASTLAFGLCRVLSERHKVMYINAATLQSFDYLLDKPKAIQSMSLYRRLLSEEKEENEIQLYGELMGVLEQEIFDYLPPFKGSLGSLDLTSRVFGRIVRSIKAHSDYEYVVVDLNLSMDPGGLELLSLADATILCADQRPSSIEATSRFIGNLGTKTNVLIAGIGVTNLPGMEVTETISRLEGTEREIARALAEDPGVKRLALLLI